MKKILYVLTLLVFFFIPSFVYADYVSNHNVKIEVNNDGSLLVEELIFPEGDYNGFERIIELGNLKTDSFKGSVSDFESNLIYNASEFMLLEVKSVPYNATLSEVKYNGTTMTQVNSATNGESNKFVYYGDALNPKIRMYNPSSKNQGFYIKYLLDNVVVTHNDYNEIYWNIIGNDYLLDISNLDIEILIPDNETELKVWAHGPLTGEIHSKGTNKIVMTATNVYAGNPVDFRFLFDKDYIEFPKKMTGVSALNSILKVETERAEDANRKREDAEKKVLLLTIIGGIILGGSALLLVYLVLYIYKVYNEHDKEYESTFKTDYYRDFPADYNPSTVGFLFNKQIGNNEISASILDLISRDALIYEEVEKKGLFGKKDVRLTFNGDVDAATSFRDKNFNAGTNKYKLTPAEATLISWLFTVVGTNGILNLSEIKKYAEKHYSGFLSDYEKWKRLSTKEAREMNFFENKDNIRMKGIGLSALGIVASVIALIVTAELTVPSFWAIAFIEIVIYILIIIYLATFQKRTKQGNEDYVRWNGLKKFINDFGSFEERELPQIELWEKYLVYAYVFGSAKKLSKVMKIKINEMEKTNPGISTRMPMIYRVHAINSIGSSVSSGVTSAVSAANSAKSNASGGGGGFSSGGGFGGGGGGGGTF